MSLGERRQRLSDVLELILTLSVGCLAIVLIVGGLLVMLVLLS